LSRFSVRFEPIEEEFGAAVQTLREILFFINSSTPKPNLRIVILNQIIVTLTSVLEETLKNLLTEYLMVKRSQIGDHRALAPRLQKANIDAGIANLKNAMSDANNPQAAIESLNLFRCVSGSPDFVLWSKEIVHNRSNLRSAEFTDVAKRVGFEQIWISICDNEATEDWTGEVNVDARASRIIAQWNEVFDERNIVVHNLSQASGWGETKIVQSIDLFELVVKSLSKHLQAELA
jgi:hypothetical protein